VRCEIGGRRAGVARFTPLFSAIAEARSTDSSDERCSSNSAVSAVFSDALAFMTMHSCRGLADLGLTPDTGT
jgi:hypothetical protein